jgi:hypothetical protein
VKHSNGPWTADGPDQFGDYNIHEPGIRVVVAAVISNLRHPEEIAANARLVAAAPDLLEAAQLLEAAEHARQDCDECDGEGEPEACGTCFPSFDDARVKRRRAIVGATGKHLPESSVD